MKSIMKTIEPKICANVMNNKQSILIIKNKREVNAIQKLIAEYGYADIYCYCMKDKKNYLYWDWYDPPYVENEWFVSSNPKIWSDDRKNINGPFNCKIKFKFRCYKVEEIYYQTVFESNPLHLLKEESGYGTDTLCADEFIKNTCLTDKELENYLNTDKPNKKAYAIHISDLEIFNEPKELRNFYKFGYLEECRSLESHLADIEGFNDGIDERYIEECYKVLDLDFKLTKAPQNFCYVEME